MAIQTSEKRARPASAADAAGAAPAPSPRITPPDHADVSEMTADSPVGSLSRRAALGRFTAAGAMLAAAGLGGVGSRAASASHQGAPMRQPTATATVQTLDVPTSKVTPPGEGDVFEMTPTERFVWKATGATTGGAFDCFEASMQPGYPGAPEHVHDEADELFYVLEGAFRFKLGDEIVPAPTGTFAYAPKGTPHTWVNADEGVARMLTLFLPGGMRGLFEATSPLLQANPPDLAAITEATGRFATRIVGPPLVP